MDHNYFTGADKTMRNLKITAMISVPVVLMAILMLLQGASGGWIVLGIVAFIWILISWRFAGVGKKGLPEQK